MFVRICVAIECCYVTVRIGALQLSPPATQGVRNKSRQTSHPISSKSYRRRWELIQATAQGYTLCGWYPV